MCIRGRGEAWYCILCIFVSVTWKIVKVRFSSEWFVSLMCKAKREVPRNAQTKSVLTYF